ncbi:MAG: glycosyltransferase family 4 protein [Candidatus Woesearchaeota archaeon]
MKVAIVGFTFNHPTARRSLAVFDLLAKRYNIQLDIITVSRWGTYVYDDLKSHSRANLRIHTLRSVFLSRTPSQYKSFMPSLFLKLISLKPDVIYAHEEPATINALSAFLAAKVLRVPFVVTSWENLFQPWFFPLNIMEKLIARNADLFIAGTSDVRKVFMQKGAKKARFVVMPLSGVDTITFRPLKSNFGAQLGLRKDNTIVFVGRIIEMKGIRVILNAIRILRKRGRAYKYLFVGYGSQNDPQLVQEIKNFDKGDIVFLENLERGQIPAAFNSAAISLYPSVPTSFWAEQFGFSVAESLACKVPVVASNLTGPRYIIRDGEDGFLVKAKDPKLLAEKIDLLMRDKALRARFGALGRKDVEERFSNSTLAQTLFKIFTKKLRH